MSTEISIRVPKVIATPAEFAEWEGYSRGSVYQMIHNGKLANYIEKKEKNKGRVSILYLKYKQEQARKNMERSAFNYKVVVGQ
ncbi:phage regulatory protein [Enterobacter hormaechei]|uniref:Rha family transcriptional regulator n=1 Tax=Enterobacter hormaechei TaxID=158836 RepID=UPI00125ABCFE|nr:Rha family transcriptional regulator [Enterobacter hormaechei]VAK51820.1 phage regulatory protein [Enterobacter hormaechei]